MATIEYVHSSSIKNQIRRGDLLHAMLWIQIPGEVDGWLLQQFSFTIICTGCLCKLHNKSQISARRLMFSNEWSAAISPPKSHRKLIKHTVTNYLILQWINSHLYHSPWPSREEARPRPALISNWVLEEQTFHKIHTQNDILYYTLTLGYIMYI